MQYSTKKPLHSDTVALVLTVIMFVGAALLTSFPRELLWIGGLKPFRCRVVPTQ
jgi:hypothetical protein